MKTLPLFLGVAGFAGALGLLALSRPRRPQTLPRAQLPLAAADVQGVFPGWRQTEGFAPPRPSPTRGIDAVPVFRYQQRKDGSYLYHILVEKPDGTVEDPSRVQGMR